MLINKEVWLRVFVCDAMMGLGKSSAAITHMNENRGSKFIYITPYLDEVDRIERACSVRNFRKPTPKSKGGKLEDLYKLVSSGQNIASTHALFARYTPDIMDAIAKQEYCLVMDEVFCVMEDIKIARADVKVLFDAKYIRLDGDKVEWLNKDYDGTKYSEIKDMSEQGVLYFHNNKFMFWSFPIEIFRSFKEIFVLTYMFCAQMQKYYFDMNNIDYKYVYTTIEDGQYRFSRDKKLAVDGDAIRSLIHIIDDKKLNDAGHERTNLSLTWYTNASRMQIDRIRRNLTNYFKHKVPSSVDQRMWTAYKDVKGRLSLAGGVSSFVSYNIRGTNKYRDRTVLAYLVNVHLVPHFKSYFKAHGIRINERKYALSEMLQWIWRSAIRDGKEVWIYVPSKRMRSLLIEWMGRIGRE